MCLNTDVFFVKLATGIIINVHAIHASIKLEMLEANPCTPTLIEILSSYVTPMASSYSLSGSFLFRLQHGQFPLGDRTTQPDVLAIKLIARIIELHASPRLHESKNEAGILFLIDSYIFKR